MTEDVVSVDLNELPMRIAKSSTKCFKDYLIMVHVSANVSCKKLLEVLPILTFRVFKFFINRFNLIKIKKILKQKA